MADYTRTEQSGSTYLVSWTLTQGDPTGQGASIPGGPDKTFQLTGTPGGASVSLEGSNDGTNWNTLHDFADNEITFAASAITLIAENPLWIRPVASGASGTTNLEITILYRSRL